MTWTFRNWILTRGFLFLIRADVALNPRSYAICKRAKYYGPQGRTYWENRKCDKRTLFVPNVAV